MKSKFYLGLLSMLLIVGMILVGCSSTTSTQTSAPASTTQATQTTQSTSPASQVTQPTTPTSQTTPTSVSSTPTAAAPDYILVGALLDESSFAASTDAIEKQGYDLAVSDINKDGGIFVQEYGKKIPIKMVYVDDESNPQKAVAGAEALNSQYKVPVAVGTEMVSLAADTFEKDQLPVVTSLATINAIMAQGYKYYFHIGGLDSDKAQSVLDVFNNLPQNVRPTKYAIFEEQFAFVPELMGYFKQDAAKMGLDIVYSGQYATNAPDLTSLIKGAQNAGAQVVLAAPNTGDAITLEKQMAQLNYHPQGVVMIRGADDPSWAKLGALGNYAIGAPDWHMGLNYPGTQQFVDEYKAQYGTDPHPDAGICYAIMQVVASAIEKAGSLDRQAIRDALSASDASTIEGTVKFDSNGQMLNPPPVVCQWQGGEQEQLVWPEGSGSVPLIYPIPSK